MEPGTGGGPSPAAARAEAMRRCMAIRIEAPLLLWAKYLGAGLQRYAYDTKREGSFKRNECLRMRYPSRVLASLAGNYVFLSALNCSFVRRASWIARGREGQTVVQFGKFKGRTFEEARALYFRTQLSMTWCI